MAPADTRATLCALLLVCVMLLAALYKHGYPQGSITHCTTFSEQLLICPASDMLRLRDRQTPVYEHENYDFSVGGVVLHAARNEVVAFQLIAHRLLAGAAEQLSVTLSPLQAAAGTFDSSANTDLFQAWYHPVKDGAYSWGPKSAVLPWPGNYPDALVPQTSGCKQPQTLFETVRVRQEVGSNTAIWLDLYVPANQPPGNYTGYLIVTSASGTSTRLPVSLHVHEATLPDQPSIDAVGEVYVAYAQEGVGQLKASQPWIDMAHCYQRMAHQHRMVFIERWNHPTVDDWDAYRQYAGPMLDGSLFSPAKGYTGPGQNTPLSVWRTPWPQVFNGRVTELPSDTELRHFERNSARWQKEVLTNNWLSTRYFAYVFDEVDGPVDNSGADVKLSRTLIENAHRAMQDVQQAIDRGADEVPIDLMWTSHSDPRQWLGDEEVDLVGITRLWVPNASAAPSEFLQQRMQAGERAWFYHSGHPSVGVHAINASGIDMRSWGVITARYQLDGNLMWAVNLGDIEFPYRLPVYKRGDDRFGNGVLVYPGNLLPEVGFAAIPGPVPSMRLKAWRRGLQDAELAELARANGHDVKVQHLLRKLVPVALADAHDRGVREAQWSQNPADWVDLKINLLQLASQRSR